MASILGSVISSSKDSNWWVFTVPAYLGTNCFAGLGLTDSWTCTAILITFFSLALLSWTFTSGGLAWKNNRAKLGSRPIPGPRGLPILGSILAMSRGLAHRTLAGMAKVHKATELMAFSLGSTPVVVASEPVTAREILTSPNFADRPVKKSAKTLLFERAIGFAPNGTYWRMLRGIAASHLFAPRRVAAHEPGRQADCAAMLSAMARDQACDGAVTIRPHLQDAALNNIMGSVFGKRLDLEKENREVQELKEMVREGFELLGAFNFSDYLPFLGWFYDPLRIVARSEMLVPRVQKLVRGIIAEHRQRHDGASTLADAADFVDVLLSLQGEEKLEENDMVAVLWEMIFRGTDTTALLTEWALAELVLHPSVQTKLRTEIDTLLDPTEPLSDAAVAKLPYLSAVIKETLRAHPPGPLLSWARLSTSDVQLSNGMLVPAGTTAMVNMWAITHDEGVWDRPEEFRPERFVVAEGGEAVDVRGSDLRLAPFGAGRRVCPGKSLGLVTVAMWVAKLVRHFEWVQPPDSPVDLSEVLKLSCEMKNPLRAIAVPRVGIM
ncbi:hypothetical protein AMTRI_Chr04g252330 [Amborella trichopoda]